MALSQHEQKLVAFLKHYRIVCEGHGMHVIGIIGANTSVLRFYFPDQVLEGMKTHIFNIINEEYEEDGNTELTSEKKQEIFSEVYPE